MRRGGTFLPITPRQAIDGIAILLGSFGVGARCSETVAGITGGGGMWQFER